MKYFLTLIQLWVGFLSICASYPKANIWIIPSVESPQVYRNYAQTSKVHLEMARGEVEHIQLGTFIKYYKISQLIHTQSIAN